MNEKKDPTYNIELTKAENNTRDKIGQIQFVLSGGTGGNVEKKACLKTLYFPIPSEFRPAHTPGSLSSPTADAFRPHTSGNDFRQYCINLVLGLFETWMQKKSNEKGATASFARRFVERFHKQTYVELERELTLDLEGPSAVPSRPLDSLRVGTLTASGFQLLSTMQAYTSLFWSFRCHPLH